MDAPRTTAREVSQLDRLVYHIKASSCSPKKPRARPGWSCAVNSDDILEAGEWGTGISVCSGMRAS